MKPKNTDLSEFLSRGGVITKLPLEYARDYENIQEVLVDGPRHETDEFEEAQRVSEAGSLKFRSN